MSSGNRAGPSPRYVDSYVVARPNSDMGLFRTEAYSKSDILYRRDNYHKWPWTAILVTCTVSGLIFLYIGIPRATLSGSSLYMSIGLTVVGIIVLLPIILVLPICLTHKICKACGKKVPKCCLCLDPLLERNRSAKKNINFYEHKAKSLKTSHGGRPSVFVIHVPDKNKHRHSPHSQRHPSHHHPGQSIALSHSSHTGETTDYSVETEFNSNHPQSSRISHVSSSHTSKSNGSTKSSAQRPSTLRQEAAKSQFAPKGTYNQAYVDEESSQRNASRAHRSHRTKGSNSDSHLDNQGFSPDGGDPAYTPSHPHHHPQQNGYKQQPIEVLVQIVDSITGDTTTTTIVDSIAPVIEAQPRKTEALEETGDAVDENNNNNTYKTTAYNQKSSPQSDRSSRQESQLSVDTDIITEENIALSHTEDDDKNSAVCDVEEYVFGGDDEIVDARSDFRTDRHSPHSKKDDPKEEFHFDHRSSVNSSNKSEKEILKTMEEDLPSDCSVITLSSPSKQKENSNKNSVAASTASIKDKKTADEVVRKEFENNNYIDNMSYLTRSESDRSLASFFTQTTHVSRDRFELETLNSQLDPGDTYSLISESEFSIARESMESRARIEALEEREIEIRTGAESNASNSSSTYSSDGGNEWKKTRWNRSFEADIFSTVDR